nr:helix-turn-helix domain-containing protein [Stenotrophomonas mori]
MNALEGAVGCGEQLRQAREAAGLTLSDVAARLHMPVQVVGALEQEQWERLGAPVFVRGQLRSYARLLGVDLDGLLQKAGIAPVEPPRLVSHTHTPRLRRMAENLGRRAVYVVITAALAVPVWYALDGKFGDAPPSTASLDVVPDRVPAAPSAAAGGAGTEPAARPQADRAPYIASMAPLARPSAAVRAPAPDAGMTLDFRGDSWMEVSAPDGSIVEKALVRAGEKRSYTLGQVGRIKVGNATEVDLRQDGESIDLAGYTSGNNVARFTVSSDGSVAPVSH